MEKVIKVILADDKDQYRQSIREILKLFPVSVIGEAKNGTELLTLLKKDQQPDIILLDLEMPVMNGNRAFELICKAHPNIKIIILSFYFENLLIENYIERGAKGYLPKDAIEPTLLMEALQQVMSGAVYIFENSNDKRKYTYRQKEIVPLILEGLTNDEIADEVCITKRAVEKQRHNIYLKIGAYKAIEFYKYAFSKGLQFLSVHKRPKKEKKKKQGSKCSSGYLLRCQLHHPDRPEIFSRLLSSKYL